jgi:uncharacterized membrane protein
MTDMRLPTPSLAKAWQDGHGKTSSQGKPPMPAQSVAVALHVLGAVIWVGGMFLIYVCLRPALGALEPPQRLRLMRVTLAKFFPFVWVAILLILASGYWMIFVTFGGFKGLALYINWMQLFGWLMIGLFLWLFHGPWLAFKRAVDAQDWPGAAKRLDQIRQIIAVALPLGLLVIVIGASGRYWG